MEWKKLLDGLLTGSGYAIPVGILGFLGKWWFDRIAEKLKARDAFAAKTADHIAMLANTHYWAIYNAAGTLALALRAYLRAVEAHFYLDWESPADLQNRLSEIAEQTSKETLVSLTRMLWHFRQFQFEGSQTYLLPHHGAGRQLRRLYNRFQERLPSGNGEQKKDLVYRLLQALELHAPRNKEGRIDIGAVDLASADWPPRTDGDADVRSDYARWLRDCLPDVQVAAESIETFARLLQNELSILYRNWHLDRTGDDDIRLPAAGVALQSWPGVLAESDVRTLQRARGHSEFFGALLRGGRAEASQHRPTDQDSAKVTPPKPGQDRQPSSPVVTKGSSTREQDVVVESRDATGV